MYKVIAKIEDSKGKRTEVAFFQDGDAVGAWKLQTREAVEQGSVVSFTVKQTWG